LITVDDREATQHPEVTTLLSSPNVLRLEAGDYAFLNWQNEPIGIERAEINNLIAKIMDGELESQLRKAERLYKKFYLLTEGVWDGKNGRIASYKWKNYARVSGYLGSHRSGFQFDRMEAFLLGLDDMGVRRLYSANFEDSMRVVSIVQAKAQSPPEAHQLFKRINTLNLPVKLSDNPAVPRLMALVPRISEKTAVELIDTYETIWGIVRQPDTLLLGIDGFGKTHLKHLKENLGL
tara:strand:+ start:1840 stop:2547 length:708 start_codon:yes stop_codon:yes gene_type:complete